MNRGDVKTTRERALGPATTPLRIRDWDAHFGNGRGRGRRRPDRVSIPNDLASYGLRELSAAESATAVFGAFILMVEIASRSSPPGFLLHGERVPYDAAALAVKTGFPEGDFRRAIDVLLRIGWLEYADAPDVCARVAPTPEVPANPTPGDGGGGASARGSSGRQRTRRSAPGAQGAVAAPASTGGTRCDTPPGGAGAGDRGDGSTDTTPESWVWAERAMTTPALRTDAFRDAWCAWDRHRREYGRKLTPTSVNRQIRELESIGHDRTIAAINHSIAKGYQGIYEPRSAWCGPTPDRGKPKRTPADRGEYPKNDAALPAL